MKTPRPKIAIGGLALVIAMTGGAVAVAYEAGRNAGGSGSPAAEEPGKPESLEAKQVAATSPLPAFDNCDALSDRMRHLALPYVDAYGLRGTPRYEELSRRFGGIGFDEFATTDTPAATDAAGTSSDDGDMATAQQAPAAAADAGAPAMDTFAADAAAPSADAAAPAADAAAAAPAADAAAPAAAAAAPKAAKATKSSGSAKSAAAPRSAAGESAGAGGQRDVTVDASRPIDKAGVTVNSSSKGNAASAGVSSSSRASEYNDPEDAVGPGETGTNLQEAEVDEPDTAKTDGRLIVSLSGQWLRIVDVSGDEPVARGSLNVFELGVRPQDLLLSGHRALVLGPVARHQGAMAKPTKERDWYSPAAALALIDLSNPDDPRVISTERITGTHVSARMTGDTVRVVVSSAPDLAFIQPGSNPGSRSSAEDYNRDVVGKATAEDWRPTRIIWDGKSDRAESPKPLVDCEDVRYPSTESGVDMLTVLTMDLGSDDALSEADTTSVVAAGDLVYASPERLYVATTEGGWGRFSTRRAEDKGTTEIHEFDISGNSETPYRSSGTVSGYIPGRWAMSEFDGDLRVVTTTRRPWEESWQGGETVSNIVVLRPRKDRLVEVGHVSGMGKGETVRSVRWFDELAAVVTFRQTDPLYIVDMSEPEKPVLRGELKIPGFSEYMHPIGDHRLLGVGQDATEWGAQRGLQVSAFDIADPDRPRRTDAVTWSRNSSSIVETDPRTFVYLPDRRTALLPATLSEFNWRPGLVSAKVSKTGNLTKGASWYGGRYGGVVKIISLPGGRLAAIERNGLTVLDLDGMKNEGSTYFER